MLCVVGIAQCRALDCDFKGCRCKSYYLPVLPTFFNSKKKTLSVSQKITSAQLKRRNVDYAHEWAYDTLVSNYRALKDVYSRKHAIAPIMRFFCKRTNQNKLYV